jgi:aminodeoxyfutalosine synthase
MTLPQLLELIRGAGKVPAERDSFYQVLREFGPDDTGRDDTAVSLAGVA